MFVISDFSGQMVQMAKEKFDESDFKLIKGNKVVMDAETDYTTNGKIIDLNAIVKG